MLFIIVVARVCGVHERKMDGNVWLVLFFVHRQRLLLVHSQRLYGDHCWPSSSSSLKLSLDSSPPIVYLVLSKRWSALIIKVVNSDTSSFDKCIPVWIPLLSLLRILFNCLDPSSQNEIMSYLSHVRPFCSSSKSFCICQLFFALS